MYFGKTTSIWYLSRLRNLFWLLLLLPEEYLKQKPNTREDFEAKHNLIVLNISASTDIFLQKSKIPEILCGFASGVIRLLALVKMQFRPTSSSTQCTVGKISTFLDFQFFLLQLGFEPLWFTTYKISQEFEYHGG